MRKRENLWLCCFGDTYNSCCIDERFVWKQPLLGVGNNVCKTCSPLLNQKSNFCYVIWWHNSLHQSNQVKDLSSVLYVLSFTFWKETFVQRLLQIMIDTDQQLADIIILIIIIIFIIIIFTIIINIIIINRYWPSCYSRQEITIQRWIWTAQRPGSKL